LDNVVLNEASPAPRSAKRQEIPLQTDVVSTIQSRSPITHAAIMLQPAGLKLLRYV
jgi:hypothetical protein